MKRKGSKNWYITRRVNGKPRPLSTETTIRAEAEEILRLFNAGIARRKFAPSPDRDCTTDEFWATYSEWVTHFKEPGTIALEKIPWQHFLDEFPMKSLGELTAAARAAAVDS